MPPRAAPARKRYFTPSLARRVESLLAAALIVATTGCLHRRHRTARSYPPPAPAPSEATSPPRRAPQPGATPAPAPIVRGKEGIASWYGHPYHGRPTSSGEIYNMYDMTAAHRTLPFGTQVRVHDLEDGQSAVVRINDRGPFVEGRIIDLSYAAAKAIGMVGPGTALVRLEILNPQALSATGAFAVQVGAFRDEANAERLRDEIAPHFGPVVIESFNRGDGLLHRVRVGRESTEQRALELGERLREANLATNTYVVRMN